MIFKISVSLNGATMTQRVEVPNAAAAITQAMEFAGRLDYSNHTGGFGLTVAPVREDGDRE